jgi:hypothetical protein
MRADPARWAERLEKQREGYARRKADPEWEAKRREKYLQGRGSPEQRAIDRERRLHAYWHEGGREEAMIRRAEARLRKQFAQILTEALRAELERRGGAARIAREARSARMHVWITDRRRRWEAGEYEGMEPVFRNGDLHRLPAAPLAKWIERQPSMDTLEAQTGIAARSLSRYTNGESITVALDVVDQIVTRTGALLIDIYDPAEFPVLYEEVVPDEEQERLFWVHKSYERRTGPRPSSRYEGPDLIGDYKAAKQERRRAKQAAGV